MKDTTSPHRVHFSSESFVLKRREGGREIRREGGVGGEEGGEREGGRERERGRERRREGGVGGGREGGRERERGREGGVGREVGGREGSPNMELKCMRTRYKCYVVINYKSICVNYYVLLQL